MTNRLGAIPPLPERAPRIEPPTPPATVTPASDANAELAGEATNGEPEPVPVADSVLKRFQEAMNAAPTERVEAPAAPRVSRRQQLVEQSKEVGSRPFVQKAMELFEVAPGQFRYSPPEGDGN